MSTPEAGASMPSSSVAPQNGARPSASPATVLTIFLAFLKLGLTSFGGPSAHLGYFRDEFVCRRGWFTDEHYAELVAICQFLPGPGSSQVGLGIGLLRGGYLGAAAAFIGFTTPSVVALTVFAMVAGRLDGEVGTAVIHGLKVVAVAVVATAVFGMARQLLKNRVHWGVMVGALLAVLLSPETWVHIAVITVAALAGWRLRLAGSTANAAVPLPRSGSPVTGAVWLGLFVALLVALPVLAAATDAPWLAFGTAFYSSGALVFGGGHVVLPLVEQAVVEPGWVTENDFLTGYGAAQAVPGPLFTFAAYLGASHTDSPAGWGGALLAVAFIFAPAILLVFGVLPLWSRISHVDGLRHALSGVNAAVVGLLAAALYQPVFVSGVTGPASFGAAVVAAVALAVWKIPPWVVVVTALIVSVLGAVI